MEGTVPQYQKSMRNPQKGNQERVIRGYSGKRLGGEVSLKVLP
jgi:hypothetical protein